MARNAYPGPCYKCGGRVEPGTGHFERYGRSWRVKHADHSGHGRITCDMWSMTQYAAKTAEVVIGTDKNTGA